MVLNIGRGRSEFSRKLPGDQERTIGAYRQRVFLGTRDRSVASIDQSVNVDSSANTEPQATEDRLQLKAEDDGTDCEAVISAVPAYYDAGRVVAEFVATPNQPLIDLDLNHTFGFISNRNASSSFWNIGFRPDYGDETEGNIIAQDGSEDPHESVEGTFSYPRVQDGFQYYCIVLDFERGETRFLANDNPFIERGTVIPVVPDRLTQVGAKIENDVGDGWGTEHLGISMMGLHIVP